jgi:hypothetical protein
VSFLNIENLTGGSDADSFVLAGGSLSGMISGGSGVDTLVGLDTDATWDLTSSNAGSVAGVSFAEIENLFGGSGADTFVFSGGSVASVDGGAGADTLDYSAYTTSMTVDLAAGTATAFGGFANIENIIGGFGFDTLVGPDADATWDLTGSNAGDVAGVSFTGVENLSGGSGDDAFVFSGGSIAGGDGGAGVDTLDYSVHTSGIIVDFSANTATAVGGIADIENVIGGSGSDTLLGPDAGATWNLTGPDTGSVAGVSFLNVENLTGGSGADSFILAGGSLGGMISGGSGSDTLLGSNADATWNLTSPNAGSVAGISFTEIENLNGGSSADAFVFSGGSVAGVDGGSGADTLDYSDDATGVTIDLAASTATMVGGFADIEYFIGGSGSDTLVGPDADATWDITGSNAGDVAGISLTDFENLFGGSGADTFAFSDGSVVSVDGGLGLDTLDYFAYTTGVTVNLAASTATAVGGFADIENVIGGTGADMLVGPDADAIWDLTGSNTGDVAGVSFTGIENLSGGSGADTFVFSGGSIAMVDGGSGVDTLNYFADLTGVTIDLAAGTATDVGGFANIENIFGGFGFDTLVGPDVDATWEIISPNAGSVASVSFTYIETLSGGFGDDVFVFSGGSVVGLVDGGAGADTLNYAAYTTGITVDLAASMATAVGGFADIESVIRRPARGPH